MGGKDVLFHPTTIDLGNVGTATELKTAIEVLNASFQTRKLIGCQKSCSCISLETFPLYLRPGENRPLRVSLGAPSEPGRFSYSIKFFRDNPDHPFEEIFLSGVAVKQEQPLASNK